MSQQIHGGKSGYKRVPDFNSHGGVSFRQRLKFAMQGIRLGGTEVPVEPSCDCRHGLYGVEKSRRFQIFCST